MIRNLSRRALRIAVKLILMLAIAGVVMFFWFRTSLPRLDGSGPVAGLAPQGRHGIGEVEPLQGALELEGLLLGLDDRFKQLKAFVFAHGFLFSKVRGTGVDESHSPLSHQISAS